MRRRSYPTSEFHSAKRLAPSRRGCRAEKTFPTLAGSVVILGAALSLGTEMAEAHSKVDKKTAKYSGHPNKGSSARSADSFSRQNFAGW